MLALLTFMRNLSRRSPKSSDRRFDTLLRGAASCCRAALVPQGAAGPRSVASLADGDSCSSEGPSEGRTIAVALTMADGISTMQRSSDRSSKKQLARARRKQRQRMWPSQVVRIGKKSDANHVAYKVLRSKLPASHQIQILGEPTYYEYRAWLLRTS